MTSIDVSAVVVAIASCLVGALLHLLYILMRSERAPASDEYFEDPIPTWSNRPRPHDYMINSRGEKLYFELHGPDASDPACKGVIFLNVGYSAHVMRPTYWTLIQSLAEEKYIVAVFDWAGQGYSQGVRCLVDPPGMAEDYGQFVEMVMARCPTQPWYCMGQSMAGAVVLLFSFKAWEKRLRLEGIDGRSTPAFYANFRGCVGVAPLIMADKPPAPVFTVLSAVAWVFPMRLIPGAVSPPLPDAATWVDKDVIKWAMTHDRWGSPGGLGWARAMRWGSAVGLFALSDALVARAEAVPPAFPLLIIHDPKDRITPFRGSRWLMDRCTAARKLLVEVPGGRHDLYCNRAPTVAATVLAWIEHRPVPPPPPAPPGSPPASP